MDKKISVALATYKGATYIGELLDSLAKQHTLPYELVVSDDNSPDETLAIVEAFATHAPFKVRIIRNLDQLGIIENFAKAFENCEGELIAYCDQDDIWAPEKLTSLLQPFADPKVKLVMHRSEAVNGALQPLGYHIPEKHEIEVGTVTFPSSAEMTYGLGHQMLFDAQIYRDYAWIFRQGYRELDEIAANYDTQFRFLAGLNGSIVSLDDVLVKFRRHESATSDAGLVDNKTATKSGFLGKTATVYLDEAEKIAAIAAVFQREVLPKMPQHSDRLSAYIAFLTARSAIVQLRGKIYADTPFARRIGIYLSLVAKGAYRQKRQRGLGRKALLVDAFVSLCGLRGAQKLVARKG